MEVYIKTCYHNLIRLTGDFFLGRNRGTVYVTTCTPNNEMTIDSVSGVDSDCLNRKYHINLAPETYAGYILEEIEKKILDNTDKLSSLSQNLIIDFAEIENTVFNNRIPDEIKEGKIKVVNAAGGDPLYYGR